jgi:hypothetical protein
MADHIKFPTLTLLTLMCAWRCLAADTVIVESRTVDDKPNTPRWTELSGTWSTSKNKTRVADASSLMANKVSICITNDPAPAFEVAPAGLVVDTPYKVEVTFGSSTAHAASPDLMVAVATEGVATNTIPTNTAAFGPAGINTWTVLGTITPSTNCPKLRFAYLSGTLSREARWYADTIRFTPEPASKPAK